MNTGVHRQCHEFIPIMVGVLLGLVCLPGSGQVPSPTLPPQGAAAAAGAPATPETGAGPQIRFAATIHNFGRVVSGAVLRHDFVFTNTGRAVLEITGVHPSCGCTPAGEWTRRVEPGQTGVIPIQLYTAGFQGQVVKHITVSCNDPQQPTVALLLRAEIWNPIELSPRYATLHANPERLDQARSVIHIVNREEAPLRLEAPQSSSPHLKAELVEREPGREFDLVIAATDNAPPGDVQGVITMDTSSTNLPKLSVTALLLMQPVVTVAPPFLQLAPGPLPTPQTLTVAVVNNGTNQLHLSDVTVNNTNVTVEVQETNPGRYFNVLLHFPAGFQIPAGQVLALTANTSHPNHPQLRVPIAQSRGPVAPPPALPPPPQPQPAVQAGPPPLPAPNAAPAPAAPGARPAAASPAAPAAARPARPPLELPPMPGT
jgi:hypothetical protein